MLKSVHATRANRPFQRSYYKVAQLMNAYIVIYIFRSVSRRLSSLNSCFIFVTDLKVSDTTPVFTSPILLLVIQSSSSESLLLQMRSTLSQLKRPLEDDFVRNGMTKLKTIAGCNRVTLWEEPHKTIAEARFEADKTIATITAELAAEKQGVAQVKMEMAAVEAKLETYMHMHASYSGHTRVDDIESDDIQHKCARLHKLVTLLECVFP